MKKGYPFLIMLVLAALACEIPSSASGKTQTTTRAIERHTATKSPVFCAIVTAERAQNVRADADAASRILFHIKHGEQVQVVNQDIPLWWKIESARGTGYARTTYLQITPCEE